MTVSAIKDEETGKVLGYKLRCHKCDRWVGEAYEELAFVTAVPKGTDSGVSFPRDVRACNSCDRLNVFVPKAELLRRFAS